MNAITPPAATATAPLATPAAPPAPKPSALLRRVNETLAVAIPPLLVVAALFLLWEWLCSGPGATLPPPSRVWSDSKELILNPFYDRGGLDKGLGLHLMASLQRVALGFALSVVVGVGLGMLVGSSRLAMRGLDPIFQVLRTVPPLAWLPLSLAAFREAQPSAIFVIFITAVWPIIINTAVGVRNVPADYRNVARVIRLRPHEWFLRIVVPAAAPYIFTGLRIGVGLSWLAIIAAEMLIGGVGIGVGLSWLAIIAAEMLIGGVGIGFFIWDAWNSSNLSDIIVALIYVGLVGFVLDRIMAFAGRAVTRGTTEQ